MLLAIIFKLFPRFGIDTFQAIVFNYFASLIAGSIQLGYFPIPAAPMQEPWFYYVLFLGVIFIIGFNSNAYATQKIGISYTALIQKLSLIIPTIIAIAFFNEELTTLKIVGIIGAIIAIILIQIPSKKGSGDQLYKITMIDIFIFAVGIFIISGVIETLLFYMGYKGISTNAEIAVVSSIFGIAGITGGLLLIYFFLTGRSQFKWKNVIAGLILGIPNFYSIYLMFYLLNRGWQASVAFPINNVGIIALATLTAVIFFNEKLNGFKWAGIIIAIIAIVFISR